MSKSPKPKKRVAVEYLLETYAKAKKTFEHDGNFTIAVVKLGRKQAIGVAKKCPSDPIVQERGEQIALIRALRKLHELK